MSVGPYSPTLERFEAIDFCGYVQGDYTGMLIQYPQPETSAVATLKPFSVPVRSIKLLVCSCQ